MTSGNVKLPRGLYDQLVTETIDAFLAQADPGSTRVTPLDEIEAPQRFADHVGALVSRGLEGRELADQIKLANRIVYLLEEAEGDAIASPARILRAVGDAARSAPAIEPEIPLSAHDLLVNARGEPQLASELKKELASADRVDLIVAFVRWYGVRLLLEELHGAIQRGAQIRLLTTIYMGSTERRALDELHERGQ